VLKLDMRVTHYYYEIHVGSILPVNGNHKHIAAEFHKVFPFCRAVLSQTSKPYQRTGWKSWHRILVVSRKEVSIKQLIHHLEQNEFYDGIKSTSKPITKGKAKSWMEHAEWVERVLKPEMALYS